MGVRGVSELVWAEHGFEDIQVITFTTRIVWSVCATGRGSGQRVGISIIQGKKWRSKSYSRAQHRLVGVKF